MLNKNIKTLFKNIVYNCPIVGIKDRSIIYKVGNDIVSIYMFKKTKGDEEEIKPMNIEQVRWLSFSEGNLWHVKSPLYGDLPIYTYGLTTSFRTYIVGDLTLSEQEEIAKQINTSLEQFEKDELAKLMSASLE